MIKDWVYLGVNPIATVELGDIANGLYQTLAEINAEAMIGLPINSEAYRVGETDL